MPTIQETVLQLLNDADTDVYLYTGEITRPGYHKITSQLVRKRAKNALFILKTLGGDPNAGYRIARAFLHNYKGGNFQVFVPDECKSAGTLICIGAKELIISDTGELGPLDIQVSKPDEMFQRGSGLDIIQAIEHLQKMALGTFRDYLLEINAGSGMSTRTAADVVSKLTIGLYGPIFGQIDPSRLGEMQRAINIAEKYGDRLDKYHRNLLPDAMQRLIWKYPAHEFVIDRKEAKELFNAVRAPSADEQIIADALAEIGTSWENPAAILNVTDTIVTATEKNHADQTLEQPATHRNSKKRGK